MKLKIAVVVIIVMALMIMLFLGCFTPEEMEISEDWRTIGSQTQSTKKLHEEESGIRTIIWNDCCDGEIRVEFEYAWSFYFDEWRPEDDCCHNPVEWTVRDSLGRTVYSSDSCSPVNTFNDPEIITDGIWDCINPWMVIVENGCLYPINYRWELTLYCYD